MKHRRWLLLAVLLIAMLALSGCGVPRQGVDVVETAPQGLWQAAVVWPLAKSLIWLDSALQNMDVPYHWGFAIIAFTLIIKLITLPLTLMQVRGMQAQKELQPRLQEIQKKYGKDREALSKAQMELYQEAGVNPLSGCLPLVIQMPILFGLYSALVALGPSLENSSFFWIPDLGFPQYTKGLSWLGEYFQSGQYGLLAAYLILPVLLVVSQFAMQKWMTPTPATGDQGGMTQQISLMMTAMFGFFTLQVPAGLTLYWVTSNGIQMLQQWLMMSNSGSATPDTPKEAKSKTVDGSVVKAGDSGVNPKVNSTNTDSKSTNRPKKRRRSKKR
ncbi:MAG: membrane protein insertase YidC [Caldilineaceae bacterium]|nr:membrane protein insertase YidC [Caldilineaceae bacterium]